MIWLIRTNIHDMLSHPRWCVTDPAWISSCRTRFLFGETPIQIHRWKSARVSVALTCARRSSNHDLRPSVRSAKECAWVLSQNRELFIALGPACHAFTQTHAHELDVQCALRRCCHSLKQAFRAFSCSMQLGLPAYSSSICPGLTASTSTQSNIMLLRSSYSFWRNGARNSIKLLGPPSLPSLSGLTPARCAPLLAGRPALDSWKRTAASSIYALLSRRLRCARGCWNPWQLSDGAAGSDGARAGSGSGTLLVGICAGPPRGLVAPPSPRAAHFQLVFRGEWKIELSNVCGWTLREPSEAADLQTTRRADITAAPQRSEAEAGAQRRALFSAFSFFFIKEKKKHARRFPKHQPDSSSQEFRQPNCSWRHVSHLGAKLNSCGAQTCRIFPFKTKEQLEKNRY